MEIITGIAGAIGLARQLLELKSVAKDAPAKLLIAELQLKLAEVQSKMAVMMIENQQLRADLTKATAPPDVVFKDGVYYRATGDGPFCTTCHDGAGQLIRLSELPLMFHAEGRWRCGKCQNRFQPVHAAAAPTLGRPH